MDFVDRDKSHSHDTNGDCTRCKVDSHDTNGDCTHCKVDSHDTNGDCTHCKVDSHGTNGDCTQCKVDSHDMNGVWHTFSGRTTRFLKKTANHWHIETCRVRPARGPNRPIPRARNRCIKGPRIITKSCDDPWTLTAVIGTARGCGWDRCSSRSRRMCSRTAGPRVCLRCACWAECPRR